ncbi:MAG: DUF1302 family protein [Burkholderiales bacterium]|nr:DUF1302 family protein [Burkholderiales bacterium]
MTRNGSLFYSEDYACRFGYAPSGLAAGSRNRSDGCATRDALALSLTFMPQWVQPFPGLALSMPISISYGLRGNSPSQANNMTMRWNYLRMDLKGAPVWSYSPGQRRVRLAPEFSYDGVSVSSGGILLYDESSGYDGVMDRFDFQLKGRKEMFIPYNVYALGEAGEKANTPNHLDQAAVRWELHRVWVVEATLKPGERHVQKKKVFYIDEDSWIVHVYNGFDQAGKPHHLFYNYTLQGYDWPAIQVVEYGVYDLTRRSYIRGAKQLGIGSGGEKLYGAIKTKSKPSTFFTPDDMAGRGVR